MKLSTFLKLTAVAVVGYVGYSYLTTEVATDAPVDDTPVDDSVVLTIEPPTPDTE